MPRYWSFQFQDDGTRIFSLMKTFHNELMMYMIFLFILILWFLVSINFQFAAPSLLNLNIIWIKAGQKKKYLNLMAAKKTISSIWKKKIIYKHHNTVLEITWTVLPTFFLIAVSIPSLLLIYLMNRPGSPWKHNLTIQIISSQWYWSYTHEASQLFNCEPTPTIFVRDSHKGLDKLFNSNFSGLNLTVKPKRVAKKPVTVQVNCNFPTTIINIPDKGGSLAEANPNMFWFTFKNKHTTPKYVHPMLWDSKSWFREDKMCCDSRSKQWNLVAPKHKLNLFSREKWNSRYGRYTLSTEYTTEPTYKVATIKSNLLERYSLLKYDRNLRLLDVDRRLILPRNVEIRCLVTSTDVLHSWAIPSLGIKVDACPGRLNEVRLVIYRNSVFYGQCSEICGIMHGFMPIVIQSVNLVDYLRYILTLTARSI